MEQMQKIEIIVESVQLRRVVETLEALGVEGYTVLRDVEGKGGRGERSGDELTGILKNVYLMTVCPPEATRPLVEAIRPLLSKRGGVCIVSDCQWAKH